MAVLKLANFTRKLANLESYYTLIPSEIPSGMGPSDEIAYIRNMYDAKIVKKIPNGNYILMEPTTLVNLLTPIDPTMTWPCAFIINDDQNVIRLNLVSQYNYSINDDPIKIVYWGLIFDYNLPNTYLCGIYYRINGKSHVYGPDILMEGILSFVEILRERAHIAITNSNHTQKLQTIMQYAKHKNVDIALMDVYEIFHLDISTLIKIEYPGINWDFPDVVEQWFINKQFVSSDGSRDRGGYVYKSVDTLQSLYEHHTIHKTMVAANNGIPAASLDKWHTDYIRRDIDMHYNEKVWNLIYDNKLQALEAVAFPMLWSRAKFAHEHVIDLKSATSLPDVQNYVSQGLGRVHIPREPFILFHRFLRDACEKLSDAKLIRGGHKDRSEDIKFYIYDSISWGIKFQLLAKLNIDTAIYVKSNEFISKLRTRDDILAIYDSGILTTRRIDGLVPIFVGNNVVYGLNGIAIFGNRDSYGYGLQGKECISSKAYRTTIDAHLRNESISNVICNSLHSSYEILITPDNLFHSQTICKSSELEAIRTYKVNIPMIVWKNKDGKYTRVYDETTKLQYIGRAMPNLLEN